jgi:hypothetical protein
MEKQLLEQIAALIRERQAVLRKTIDKGMEDLMLQIIRIYANGGPVSKSPGTATEAGAMLKPRTRKI